MNVYSIAATTTSSPSRRPVATITESLRPVALTRLAQSIAIGLGVDELQRIGGGQVREVLVVSPVVEERRQAARRRRSGSDARTSGQTFRLASRSLL